MSARLEFPKQLMKTVIGGFSIIDVPRLDFNSLEEAGEFLKVYGYDLSVAEDSEAVWKIFDQAIEMLQKYILNEGESIPEVLATREKVEDMRRLLLYASTRDHTKNPVQLWSCAILRVMHCIAHVENDLFFNYTTEIQDQILKPVQAHVESLPHGEIFLGSKDGVDQISLNKFEVKAFKEKHSMVIKTLSKPETVAIDIFDKMGVRFVTHSIFDAFRVIRYLRLTNVICFANVVPNQSKNTLFPTNLFLEIIDELVAKKKPFEVEEIDKRLQQRFQTESHRAEYKEKHNPFSDANYRVIKFICRQLIKVPTSSGQIRFFYPYEVQIMDYDTYTKNLAGTAAHGEYKLRQRKAARDRVLGEIYFAPR
ncbi:MAG: TIGR04552 family protein [Oligoflexia bacterium]|nr:TIGR04552 family protein [Oligoflexia bacterium]